MLDDTGGMFVLSPSDYEGYVDDWLEGCEAAGIPAQELTTSEALRRELLVHPKIGCAFRVPDASCDSFALCGALRESAESEGATLLTYHRVDDFRVEDWERVLGEVKAYLPGIRRGSIVRSWAGVRPLYDPATQSSSAEGTHVDNRKATRTFDVLDHATRDGVGGIGSIIGGKLTPFRLMAERTADAVCKELGVDRPCATATTELAPARAGFGGWGGEDRAEPGIWDA